MAVVKLNVGRTRGALEFVAGDLYSCSDEEAAALIREGLALPAEAPKREAAVTAPPETAAHAAPKGRKAAPKE